MNSIQAYGDFRAIDSDLWVLEGEWEESFSRRMTVIRLENGGLFIHSPIRLRDEDWKKLEAIGTPTLIVAPNAFHTDESKYYKDRYPQAKLYAPREASRKLAKSGVQVDETLPWSAEHPLSQELVCFEMRGTRMVEESVFFHRKTKTLILTDLMFYITREPKSGFEGKFLRWNQISNRFGISRIFRWVFIRDRQLALASLHHIAGWEFERVIVNHEEILSGKDARERFLAGFETLRR